VRSPIPGAEEGEPAGEGAGRRAASVPPPCAPQKYEPEHPRAATPPFWFELRRKEGAQAAAAVAAEPCGCCGRRSQVVWLFQREADPRPVQCGRCQRCQYTPDGYIAVQRFFAETLP